MNKATLEMKMPKETYTDQEIEEFRLELIGYLQKNYGKQYKKDTFNWAIDQMENM